MEMYAGIEGITTNTVPIRINVHSQCVQFIRKPASIPFEMC